MLKDITLGQYYPGDSVIHKLDPRVKLVATVVYIVSLFVLRNTAGFLVATAFLIFITATADLPVKLLWKGLKLIWILVGITAFFNLFFTQGDVLLVHWHFIKITDQGLYNAVFFSIRLIYLVLGTSVMTLTTTPNKLTDGMETGLSPLKKLGAPIHEIAMMMSIALRFIPLLGEEADRIKKAQMARGANFESGGLMKRAKALIPLLVPLFVSSFRRAEDLALAMEARCYHGGEGRTKMKPLHYAGRDGAAYVITAGYLAGIILTRVLA